MRRQLTRLATAPAPPPVEVQGRNLAKLVPRCNRGPWTTFGHNSSGRTGKNDQREPHKKAAKHRRDEPSSFCGRGAKLLPDEKTPESRNHGCTLPQAVGNRKIPHFQTR